VGATFENFYVNVSLCCPSRASILRGQYAHNTGIYRNIPPGGGFETFHTLGEEGSTVAVWLHSVGYRTALIGKYLNGYPSEADPLYIPPGWDEWYSPVDGKPYTQYRYTLNENGKQVDYGRSAKNYGSDVFARLAIDFITRSAKSGQPFFALIAPYAPHGPSTPARRHAKQFPGLQAPRSPSFNEKDLRDKPAWVRQNRRLGQERNAKLDRLYRRRARSLQAVDEMIAGLVEALRSAGALDHTYLFFASDNGFMLGEHRLGPGKVVPYEESIRVPLYVRGPGIPPGTKIAQLTGNIDLAPTWAELAGAPIPDFVDGRSLAPLWAAHNTAVASWRQAFLIANGKWGQPSSESAARKPAGLRGVQEPPDPLDTVVEKIPSFRALRLSGGQVYIEWETGELEFYNLNEDPYQLVNIAGLLDSAQLQRLSAWLDELTRCAGPACQRIENGPSDGRSP
jgi:arylsulfatase A-like enzyme